MQRAAPISLFAAIGLAPVAVHAEPIEVAELVALCASVGEGWQQTVDQAEAIGFSVLPHDAPLATFGPFFEAHTLQSLVGAIDIEDGPDFSDNPLPDLANQLPSRQEILAAGQGQALELFHDGLDAVIGHLLFLRDTDGLGLDAEWDRQASQAECLFFGRDVEFSISGGERSLDQPETSFGGRLTVSAFDTAEASIFQASTAPTAGDEFAAAGFTVHDILIVRPNR